MTLLYGRRRLGKTYLLQRYFTGGVSANGRAASHIATPAEQTTATAQESVLRAATSRTRFHRRGRSEEIAVSWDALLRYVSQEARKRDTAPAGSELILDEFPDLVEQTPELPSILQAWWDREGIHAPLFLIFCGSQLSVMAAARQRRAPRSSAASMPASTVSTRCRYYDVSAFYGDSSALRGRAENLLMYDIWRHAALSCPGGPHTVGGR